MNIFAKTLPDFEKVIFFFFFCSLNVEVYVNEGFYHFKTYMTVLPSLVLECKLLKPCNIFRGN
jgi:hypothetical protein